MGVPQFYIYLLNTFGRDIENKLNDCHLSQSKMHSIYKEYEEKKEPACQFYNNLNQDNDNAPPIPFDCLYIDMNGLIHPCSHPESGVKPEDEQEMLYNIMLSLDRLVYAIKPTTLLYLSVDGCAPRAKMNQQRGRRFISAKETQIRRHITREQFEYWDKKIREMLEINQDDEEFDLRNAYEEFFAEKAPSWDHNVITPGTIFMEKITDILHFYAAFKINTDPLFRKLKVVVSDASNPGEGEHKIISYIRQQRQDPKYPSETRHLIHALDADLLMLALLTHEPNIYVLREQNMDDKVGDLERGLTVVDIPILRRRLCLEMAKLITDTDKNLTLSFDYENLVDDFIFMCILCGNDFLPNVPGFSIREGAINYIIDKFLKWCITLKNQGKEFPYLTSGSEVNINNLIEFLSTIGTETDDHYLEKSRLATSNYNEAVLNAKKTIIGQSVIFPKKIFAREIDYVVKQYRDYLANNDKPDEDRQESDQDEDKEKEQAQKAEDKKTTLPKVLYQRMKEKLSDQVKKATEHYIMVHHIHEKIFSEEYYKKEKGWKEQYYIKKFELSTGSMVNNVKKNVVKDYVQGLVFVWKYYTVGVPSWSWYYPHHFAPLASDFAEVWVNESLPPFKLGAPHRPYSQLLSVMPKQSATSLPQIYRNLMLNSSRIASFYPNEFRRDLDGKGILWKAIPLLPFIDEAKLKSEIRTVKDQLSHDESKRNLFGHTIVYFYYEGDTEDDTMHSVYRKAMKKNLIEKHSFKVALHSSHFFSSNSGQFSGYLYGMKKYPNHCRRYELGKALQYTPIPEYTGEVDIASNRVALCVYYEPAFEMQYVGKLRPDQKNGPSDTNKIVAEYYNARKQIPTYASTKRKHDQEENEDNNDRVKSPARKKLRSNY